MITDGRHTAADLEACTMMTTVSHVKQHNQNLEMNGNSDEIESMQYMTSADKGQYVLRNVSEHDNNTCEPVCHP